MTQRNAFRETLEDGRSVVGARASSFAPALVEIYGSLGLDFVWLDFEHGGPSPWDTAGLEGLTRAGEVADVDLLVRLPTGDPASIRKCLDAGVRNLLIPRVESATEVQEAVEATRFVYDDAPGKRGIAGGRSAGYGASDDYTRREDANVCLGVMIEEADAVAELPEILSVPHLGFVFVGPADLAVQLGHPGERDHPDVEDAIRRIESAALDEDVPLGGISHDSEGAHDLLERGYQVVRVGGEFEAARQVLGDRLDRLASLRKGDE